MTDGREFLPERDTARLRAAFRTLANTRESWPAPKHLIGMLAALSHQTNFAVGCYCEDESRCHRSILRDLLMVEGAKLG